MMSLPLPAPPLPVLHGEREFAQQTREEALQGCDQPLLCRRTFATGCGSRQARGVYIATFPTLDRSDPRRQKECFRRGTAIFMPGSCLMVELQVAVYIAVGCGLSRGDFGRHVAQDFLLFRPFRPAWFRSALWRRSEHKPVSVIWHRAGKPDCNSPRAAMSRSITTAAAAAFSSISYTGEIIAIEPREERRRSMRRPLREQERYYLDDPEDMARLRRDRLMNSTARRRRSTIIPPTPSSFQRRPASQDIPAIACPPHRTTVTANRCRRKPQRASPEPA